MVYVIRGIVNTTPRGTAEGPELVFEVAVLRIDEQQVAMRSLSLGDEILIVSKDALFALYQKELGRK